MIEPADDEVDLFGKHASDLESNVSVSGNVIYGTSKYVTGYTGFSGDPEQQSGNYLAIKVEGDADRVRVKIDPSYAGLDWRTLDEDRTIVLRIHDNNQKVYVEKKTGNEIVVDEYGLNLVLEEPNG